MKSDVIKRLRGDSKIDLRQQSMLIALIAISVLFQILTGGIIFKSVNVSKLIMQNSYVLILAVGMLPCIITGNVDLSVGSVLALVSAISGKMIVEWDFPVAVTIPILLIIGIIAGAFQAYWIAYARLPAFIVTLAGQLIFRGLTMTLLEGRTLAPFPVSFSWISAGFLPQYKIGTVDFVAVGLGILCAIILVATQIHSRVKAAKYNAKQSHIVFFTLKLLLLVFITVFFTYWLGTYNGLPSVLLLMVFLIVVYQFVTSNTVLGRRLYALGGNETAAKLSGVNTNFILFLTYANMGLMSAVAAIVFTGRLNAATPTAGVGFELDAIAACYIGGASATGGVGTVIGAVIGGLVMGILNNEMSILGIGSDWQQTIKGCVLLAAVAFDVLSKKNKK